MSQRQRKKTYVDPQVQGALVRRLVLHWLAFLLVAGLVAFSLQVLSDPFRSIGEHTLATWWTHGPFLLVMLLILPVFVLDTIKLSHRFAGPIFRLRKTIRAIADGEPPQPVQFRDFDYWKGLAEDFNRMIERLSASDSTPRKENEEADLENLTATVPLETR